MRFTSPPVEPDPIPTFTPVPGRARHDGWTPHRQQFFLRALAQSGCVVEACGAVGRSPSSAYRLRRKAGAASFAGAWDEVLARAIGELADGAFSRAMHGVARPVFYRGRKIGEHRHFNDRLTMFLLRTRDPEFAAGPRFPEPWRDDCELPWPS